MRMDEMTPAERAAAIARALDQFQTELEASAPAISAVLDAVPARLTERTFSALSYRQASMMLESALGSVSRATDALEIAEQRGTSWSLAGGSVLGASVKVRMHSDIRGTYCIKVTEEADE